MKHNKKAAKHRFAPTGETSLSPKSIFKSALLGLCVAGGIGILLLLLCTGLLLLTKNPGGCTQVVAHILLCTTALLAGVASAKFNRKRLPLFCGIATGALLLLLLLVLSACIPRTEGISPAMRFALYALLPPLTTAGALLAAHRKSNKKRRIKRF